MPKLSHSFSLTLAFGMLGFCVLALLPGIAHAAAITGVICQAVDLVQNDIGKPVATAGVIAVSLAALFGRVGWGFVMTTNVGIAIIFSAGQIAAAVGGGGC